MSFTNACCKFLLFLNTSILHDHFEKYFCQVHYCKLTVPSLKMSLHCLLAPIVSTKKFDVILNFVLLCVACLLNCVFPFSLACTTGHLWHSVIIRYRYITMNDQITIMSIPIS
jgi:hypothetical protein